MMEENSNQETICINPNPTLLTNNNIPLKFYLDGLEVLEFLHTTEIIQQYGGVVTVPDGSTVILAKPKSISACKNIRFNIKWLYDSLQREKLQDIGPYLLPNIQIDDITIDNSEEMVENAGKIVESIDDLEDPRDNGKTSSTVDNNAEEIVDPIDDPEDPKDNGRSSSIVDNSDDEEDPEDDDVIGANPSLITPRQSADSILSDDDDEDDDDDASKTSTGRSSTTSSIIIDDPPPKLSPIPKQIPERIPSTSTGEMMSLHVQIDKHMLSIPVPRTTQISTVSSTRERRQSSSGSRGKCCSDSGDYLKRDMRVVPRRTYGTKKGDSGIQKSINKSKSRIFRGSSVGGGGPVRYSREEEQKIFDYIVKNNLISEITTRNTCMNMQEFLPGRSFASIFSYVRRFKKKIHTFTDDPDIIKQFKAV